MFLTSALCLGVPPVVLLTVCAGRPPKAVSTLTLPAELYDGVGKQVRHNHLHLFLSVRANHVTFCHETCFFEEVQASWAWSLPRYMRR